MKTRSGLASIFAVCILCSSSAWAQSGRKTAPTPPSPSETPAAVEAGDLSGYSESQPTPRRKQAYEDRFPGVSLGTPKKPALKNIKEPTTAPAAAVQDPDVLKVETNLVTIPISVFDRNGLYIPNLVKDDFKIYEDGKEQEIAYFGVSDKPFTVVLLLDTSLSTEYKIEEIQAAARAFVDQLKPQDRVMVVEFDGNVHVLTEPTSVRDQIYKAIKKADFGYGTSLYDAVNFTLKKRLNAIEGRKAIVLFTDGVDTTSSKSSFDSTVDLAEESEALIFPIYYNTFETNRARNADPWGDLAVAGTSESDYRVGREYLDELATYTGGRVFKPEATPGGLTRAFEGIAEELRRQYNIGYVPADDAKPGDRKRIKVRVTKPNLVIRARDSYIVGAVSPAK